MVKKLLLVERQCIYCPKKFKTTENSSQSFCSRGCGHYNGGKSYRELFNFGRPEKNEVKVVPKVFAFRSKERTEWLRIYDEKLRQFERLMG